MRKLLHGIPITAPPGLNLKQQQHSSNAVTCLVGYGKLAAGGGAIPPVKKAPAGARDSGSYGEADLRKERGPGREVTGVCTLVGGGSQAEAGRV